MASVYIREQGACIRKTGERLIIEKNGRTVADLLLSTVSSLSLFGHVQVTSQAAELLLEKGIDISYFTYSGKYLGRTAADSSKNIFLRFAQYERYQNEQERRKLAQAVVSNKIRNQMEVIRRFRYEDYDPKEDLARMEAILRTLPEKETSNEIMGVEGSCSAVYFTAYSHMFRTEMRFEKRSRRPPRDPVNVILSLGYTLLTKEVSSVLESESFETYLGFLHGIRYGRRSLPLDMVEEFRQPVIDRLVLRLFNKRMLDEFDFEREEDQVLLNDSGFRKFCTEYEKWMKAPAGAGDSRSFRNIIRIQAGQLKRALKENTEYLPYAWGSSDVSDQL